MKEKQKSPIVVQMIQALLCAYVVTGVLLIVLAFLLYRFQLGENTIQISIIMIYVISTFVGGIILGKIVGRRRLFLGFVLGIIYVALLFIITFGVYRTLNNYEFFTTFLLCIGGGTIGGIVS